MLEHARSIAALGEVLVHGFTDRHGGVSSGSFASLNLGRRWGDDAANVDENLRRVGRAAGFDPSRLGLVRQVHGARVLRAREVGPGSEADALWIRRGDPGPDVIGILTADCVPVLLVEAGAQVAAAVHSGWRGTIAGVVTRAVETLVSNGAEPSRLRAAIGPCIELDAFEVGEEVADQFPSEHVRRDLPRPHVDLVGAVRDQLIGSGLEPRNVERVGACTHANPSRYFSYRRDGAGIGQHLSFVGFA